MLHFVAASECGVTIRSWRCTDSHPLTSYLTRQTWLLERAILPWVAPMAQSSLRRLAARYLPNLRLDASSSDAAFRWAVVMHVAPQTEKRVFRPVARLLSSPHCCGASPLATWRSCGWL